MGTRRTFQWLATAFSAVAIAIPAVIPVEAALTAALLYRRFILWLPLLPGFYLLRLEPVLSRR